MEKKYIFIGVGIILVVLLSLLLLIPQEKISEEFLTKIQEAEASLEENKIINIANIYPKYENIELEYYYRYEHCSNAIERINENFGNSVEITKKKKVRKL